jgi:hypothetical protein
MGIKFIIRPNGQAHTVPSHTGMMDFHHLTRESNYFSNQDTTEPDYGITPLLGFDKNSRWRFNSLAFEETFSIIS